jgi:phosphatidylglycerophosphatase A
MTDAEPRKPRFALFVATAAGLGYLPKAPGTWGSLGGILLFLAIWSLAFPLLSILEDWQHSEALLMLSRLQVAIFVCCSLVGEWAAGKTAKYLAKADPQLVVIDEVSGQCLTLSLGIFLPIPPMLRPADTWFYWVGRSSFGVMPVNWKYLLLGFILFRAFDIWKPFPARQAESLPGGWGIMADDWVAGIYAALGLWIARMLGL